jgi:hypothetical protein
MAYLAFAGGIAEQVLAQQHRANRRGARATAQVKGPFIKGLQPRLTQAMAQAERQRQVLTYRGTDIHTAAGAEGVALDVQERISRQFSIQDPLPRERSQHFQWCNDPAIVQTGWYGIIRDVTPIPGGWRVQVQVSPRIETPIATVSFTKDYAIETYDFVAGQLKFVSGHYPPEKLAGVAFGD